MGYYTTFKFTALDRKGKDATAAFRKLRDDAEKFQGLSADDKENLREDYVELLRISDEIVSKVPSETFEAIDCDDAIKWYGHEEDMLLLSKAFPDFIFQLEGEGEDHRDGALFRKWFHRGKMQGGGVKYVWPELDLKGW